MFRFTIRDVLWLYGLSLLLLVLTSLRAAVADDAPANGPPHAIARVLKWLPEDTETLVAVQSFELALPPPPKAAVDLGPFDLKELIDDLALDELADLEKGKYLKPLLGKKVALAICVGRHFEVVSAFGSLRSESCAIIVFENALGEAGKEWNDLVRQEAKEIREIAGHKSFVFPSTTVMEGGVEPKSWQGTYLVMLRPDTLLCASSDRYLAELLQRVDTAPQGRALGDDLLEWKFVDPQAPAWMLRHVPNANERSLVSGLTWTWKKDRLEAIYLPTTRAADKRLHEAVITRWTPPKLPEDLPNRPAGAPLLGVKPDSIMQRPDGTVAVSIHTDNLGLEAAFWFGMHLYSLRREDGSVGIR